MKKTYLILIVFCLANSLSAQKTVDALKAWMEHSEISEAETQKFASKAISREEAELAAALVLKHRQGKMKNGYKNIMQEKKLVAGKYSMPFEYRVFGEKPDDGRSLYISMHGGGNTAPSTNDGQWKNQMKLYSPAEGVYFVPRAAVNDWNMWFQPHVDTLFDLIIQTAVAELDVNPDKVYLMGYSAGGDGAYRLAPRLADRWAAASMMAGHPGDVSPTNLRNIGFMLWMGEKDGAYSRNSEAVKFGQRLDTLRSNDPEGYVHETHIVKDRGHWMEHADTLALQWMEKFRRNPCPQKIAWQQDDVSHESFYWLHVPASEIKKGKKIIVERSGNTFNVTESDYSVFDIGLNDAMIDFDKPVKITVNGKLVFNKKVKRTIAGICKSVERRNDANLVFYNYITVETAGKKP